MDLLIPLLGFLAGLITSLGVSKVNWCDVQKQYCNGKQHIACEPNSFPIENKCRNVTSVPMSPSTKTLILHLHNWYRNELASGRIHRFPAARQMGVMQWDDTLQFLAEKHVSHCHFAHDQCRATAQYPYSGQNIFFEATLGHTPNATGAIERGLEGWFEEHRIAKPSVVDLLTGDQAKAFHFTVMVSDKNNRVGCAMIQYQWPENKELFDAFMLTCNYQYTNIMQQPLYKKGPACSGCGTLQCNSNYKALCNS